MKTISIVLAVVLFVFGALWYLGVDIFAQNPPVDHYQVILSKQYLVEKKEYMRLLGQDDRTAVWQRHFDDMLENEILTPAQIDFVKQARAFAAGGTCANGEAMAAQVNTLFPDLDQADRIFGTIGSYQAYQSQEDLLQRIMCNCTSNCIGNWRCWRGGGSCHAPSNNYTCRVAGGQCGFLWLCDCNSLCYPPVD